MTELSIKTDRKQYPLLDILKFIMSILIITIHRSLGDGSTLFVHEEREVIARLAVPFFFATSSFLFFTKRESTGNSENIIKPYLLRLLRLFLIWNLFYLPQNIYRQYLSNGGLNFNAFSSLITYFFKNGGFFHLWFIPALAFSVLFCHVLSKKSEKGLYIASSLLFVASIVITYLQLAEKNFGIISNTLLLGIPYVSLGYLISKNKIQLKRKTLVIILIVFLITALLEGFAVFKLPENRNYSLSRFSYMPVVFSLVSLSISSNMKPRKVHLLLRKSSMLIYYTHIIFYQEILVIIFSVLHLDKFCYNYMANFIFTLLYTAAICATVLFLENKKGFKFLKKIY